MHLPFTLWMGPGPLYSPAAWPKPGLGGTGGRTQPIIRTEGQKSPCFEEQSDLASEQSTSKVTAPPQGWGTGFPGGAGLRDRPGFLHSHYLRSGSVSPRWVQFPVQRDLCSSTGSSQKGLRAQIPPPWIPQGPSRYSVQIPTNTFNLRVRKRKPKEGRRSSLSYPASPTPSQFRLETPRG